MSEQDLAGGQAPPAADPAAPSAPEGDDLLRKKVADLEADNAKLREDRRTDRADALAAKHGFADKPTLVELLKGVPADQMQAKAEALAADLGSPAPAGSAPPVEPAGADALARMQGSDQGVSPPPPAATGFNSQLDAAVLEAIKNGANLEQIAQMQDEARQRMTQQMGAG